MPGGAHVGGGYSTYSGEERLSSHEESASPGGLAPSTSSGIKRSSAPPAATRGNDSPTVSLACDDRENAAFAAGQLLEKARLVQTTASGFFCILPLGFRVLKKIEAVCHQELAGTASPLSFPNIMPIHWLQNSDRVRAFGPSLYRVQDRRARQFFLPPTSEEAAAWLAASGIRSHRDLPQVFYQIGPKFRDEARPRAGCLRAREFVMLEVYSFHKDALCRETTYEKMDACFRRILTRVRSILGSDQAAPGPDLPDGSGNGAYPRYAEGSQISSTLEPAARWNDGRRTARLGQALFRILHKSAAEAGGPADVFFDDRQGLTLRQMQSHADLVGIPHQLIIKEDLLRAPGKARVLYISRVTGKADILPLRAALNRLKNTLFGVAMSSRR
ncbi:uncharacterized protein EMH_0032160 [Eimeria mitis]|uniref:proline--tRNA ligase n=1 Tax=Eimeria mitis TaxID=44415 RepID=U6JRP5_9EIME|nr:uncharacterized protein EMH_0032160 [Eimeria mitis]CDJ27481.1 hypothetical protein, conserved [Eimeria mitis]